ncbi:MAG: hypothetical protein Q4E33_02195 [Erysipelotrichaceae bacterium]|nr:hypothetical protein [Erysipelotrichaceae bacterium]
MKITSLYPIYLADASLVDADVDALKMVGFEEKHHFTDIDGTDVHVLNTSSDTRIDVFSNKNIQDKPGLYGLRVNVDNLDEFINFTTSIGFKKKSEIEDTETNRSIYMKSASGLKIWFIEHKK